MILVRKLLRGMKSPLLLEITPALHSNLARIEFTLATMTSLISALLLTRGFPSVSPAEIVKVPEGVDGEDEIPNGKGEEVD